MPNFSFKRYLWLFLAYFTGYFALVFCLLLIVFNGRALVAETRWNVGVWLGNGRSPTTPHPVSTSTLLVAPELQAMLQNISFAEADTYIVIPKIKTTAPIVFPDTLDNVALLKALEKGVIKYRDSAGFGETGATILLGHSSAYPWYRGKYGSVFALLEKLENNDQFAIVQKNGKTFYYLVNRKQVVVPKDFKIEIQDNQSHLVLISCWPVRSNKLRMTIWSDLIKTE